MNRFTIPRKALTCFNTIEAGKDIPGFDKFTSRDTTVQYCRMIDGKFFSEVEALRLLVASVCQLSETQQDGKLAEFMLSGGIKYYLN